MIKTKFKKIISAILIMGSIFLTFTLVFSQQKENIPLEEKIQRAELIIVGEIGVMTVTGFANAHPMVETVLYGELPRDKELVVSFVETKDFSESHNSDQKYIFFLVNPRIDQKRKTIYFSLLENFDYLGLEIASDDRIAEIKEIIEEIK